MPKISTLSVGDFIRNPKGRHASDSRQMNVEALKIVADHGNSFLCYPVTSINSSNPTVDTTRYVFISKDQNVDKISI